MKSVVLGFGLLILSLLILFSLPGVYDLHSHAGNSNWIAGFSLLFLAIGIVLSRKLFIRTQVITADKPYVIDPEQLLKLGISKREAEILLLIHDGLSNEQLPTSCFYRNIPSKSISPIFFISCGSRGVPRPSKKRLNYRSANTKVVFLKSRAEYGFSGIEIQQQPVILA